LGGRPQVQVSGMSSGGKQPDGRIVAVWGPTGAPGRSTVAAALAGALAQAGRVVLVDADLLRGSLGILLGAGVGGNLASASRFPPPPGSPCPPDHLFPHHTGFAVLRGVPGPAQGVSADPDGLAALLERLRRAFDLVIVDVGWALPDHPHGPGHLAALRSADIVLVVAAATRLGISDSLLQYPVLAERLFAPGQAEPTVWCVLNNGQGQHLESYTRRIKAETGLRVVSFVPHDCAAVAMAIERSIPLTAVHRDSPAAEALWRLAERIWLDPGRHRVDAGS